MAVWYRGGGWIYDDFTREVVYIEPHEREEGTLIDRQYVSIVIPFEHVQDLVHLLEQKGLFVPKMTRKTRDPDLKIIHRLMDIIEKQVEHNDRACGSVHMEAQRN